MQSIVIYIEPNRDAFITSEKIANFYMNRFFIDEDAGFELLGIIELGKSADDFVSSRKSWYDSWNDGSYSWNDDARIAEKGTNTRVAF